MENYKYLDETGLKKLWEKIKTKDTESLTSAKSYTDTKISGVNTTITSVNATTTNQQTDIANLKTAVNSTIPNNYIKNSQKGVANGVATLDSDGKVPESQLPAYVDDVVEYDALKTFPATGEAGKIYVDLSTNKTYRWSGSTYVNIAASIALGETSSTAYAGDKGKANATAIATLQTAVAGKAAKNGDSGENFKANIMEVQELDVSGDINVYSGGSVYVNNSDNTVCYWSIEGGDDADYIDLRFNGRSLDLNFASVKINNKSVLTEANIGAIDTATIEALS
jgi:hypothetical protein